LPPAPAAPPPPPAITYTGAGAALRYGRQEISAELNAVASALMTRLLELQARTRATDPLKAKARRRVVFGLREVAKAVRTKRAKALLVAPNVEAVAAPGGLDDALAELLAAASAAGVPVVLALTRARMGALTGRRVRMSAAAVLDASGAEEPFVKLLRLGREGCAAWAVTHPEDAAAAAAAAAAGAAPAEAFLRLRRDGRLRALLPGEAPGLPVRPATAAAV
jgi:selenocysteine insertion sequence-binding protein 2